MRVTIEGYHFIHAVPEAVPASVPEGSNERSRELQNVPGDPAVPRGNSHLACGRDVYGYPRGQEPGQSNGHARGQESSPAESKQTFGAEQKEPTTGEKSCFVFYLAQPWLGASARLIAGGVAQLQAAMLKQMTADNNGKGLQRP